MSIKIGRVALLPLPFALLVSTAACTHQSSTALTAARAEVARAENGPASRLEPTAVGDAEAALADAEAAYKDNSDRAELRAVYAQRKAQLAESLAATKLAKEHEHEAIAERNILIETRQAEARVIAERNAQQPPAAGAAEMQPNAASTSRAPGSSPKAAPQSGATKAR